MKYKVKVERVNNKYKNKIDDKDLLFISNNNRFKNKGIIISGLSKEELKITKVFTKGNILKAYVSQIKNTFGDIGLNKDIVFEDRENIFINITNNFFLRFNESYEELENTKSNLYKITPYLKITISKKEETSKGTYLGENEMYIGNNIEFDRGLFFGADFFSFENESIDIGLKQDVWDLKN